jgi:hypothetical protein
MKITLIKQLNNTFKIAFDSDFEKAKKIKVGEPLEYEYKQLRNIKFHRKLFALLNMVFQNQEIYNNIEHLRKDLTIEAGYYDLRANIHGEEIKEAKSISFANMDQDEFDSYYSAVLDTVVKYFHFDKQDIIDNIEQYF